MSLGVKGEGAEHQVVSISTLSFGYARFYVSIVVRFCTELGAGTDLVAL